MVKYLSSRHKDLSSNPKNPCEKLSMVAYACNRSIRGIEKRESLGLAGQLA